MQTSQQTEEYWTNHVEAWKLSGLTQVVYCDQNNINLNQLVYQKSKRDGKRSPSVATASSGFASVAISSCHEAGLKLTFPSGIQLSGIGSSNLVLANQIIKALK